MLLYCAILTNRWRCKTKKERKKEGIIIIKIIINTINSELHFYIKYITTVPVNLKDGNKGDILIKLN